MITGSSAFKNQENSQITSHSISATMTDNRRTVYTYKGTVGSDIINSSITYQGYLFDFTIDRVNILQMGNTYKFIGGNTLFSGATCHDAKFNDTGATLEVIYSLKEGSTYSIYKQSLDHTAGITFGSTQLLYSGSSLIDDIAVPGATRIYFLESILGITPIDEIGPLFSLKKLEYTGSWGNTIVYDGFIKSPFTVVGDNVPWLTNLNAWHNPDNNMDYIILNMYGASIGRGASCSGCGIKVLESDGKDIFNEFDLVDTTRDDIAVYTRSSCMPFGSSKFGLLVQLVGLEEEERTKLGKPSRTYGIPDLLLETYDGVRWCAPNIMSDSGIFASPHYLTLTYGKTTCVDYIFNDNGFTIMEMQSKSITVDISDKIINYTNRNNENITLNIGNYADN